MEVSPISASQLSYVTNIANQFAANRILELIARLTAMGAFSNATIVRVPVLFRFYNGSVSQVHAALPDSINMLNVNGVLVVPDPRWEPMQTAVSNALAPIGLQVRLVDCMEHHRDFGEIHCGSNTRREPTQQMRRWWVPIQ